MSKLIPLQQAVDMTTLYRKEKENILDPFYRNKNILAICETFDRSDIDTILAETDCVKLRIYFGMSDDLNVHTLVVGVNSRDEDILPFQEGNEKTDSGGGSIGEEGVRCPPTCPPGSALNGG
jgi:hypothetical protein